MTPGRLILVVEDDLSIRESVFDLLVDEGYRVVIAANGEEALARLAEEMPALMLLDLWMPLMTGAELLARIRDDRRFDALPVVILTAASDPAPEGLPVLKKPIGLDALLEAIAKHAR